MKVKTPANNFIIDGNVGAGKTSVMKELDKIFANLKEKYADEDMPELNIIEEPLELWVSGPMGNILSEQRRLPTIHSFITQAYIMGTMTTKVRIPSDVEGKKCANVLERSIFSSNAFIEMFRDDLYITDTEYKCLQQLLKALTTDEDITGYIYIDVEPEVVFERVKARDGDECPDLDYFRKLDEKYKSVVKRICKDEPADVLVVDGTLDSEELAEVVAGWIFARCNERQRTVLTF